VLKVQFGIGAVCCWIYSFAGIRYSKILLFGLKDGRCKQLVILQRMLRCCLKGHHMHTEKANNSSVQCQYILFCLVSINPPYVVTELFSFVSISSI